MRPLLPHTMSTLVPPPSPQPCPITSFSPEGRRCWLLSSWPGSSHGCKWLSHHLMLSQSSTQVGIINSTCLKKNYIFQQSPVTFNKLPCIALTSKQCTTILYHLAASSAQLRQKKCLEHSMGKGKANRQKSDSGGATFLSTISLTLKSRGVSQLSLEDRRLELRNLRTLHFGIWHRLSVSLDQKMK